MASRVCGSREKSPRGIPPNTTVNGLNPPYSSWVFFTNNSSARISSNSTCSLAYMRDSSIRFKIPLSRSLCRSTRFACSDYATRVLLQACRSHHLPHACPAIPPSSSLMISSGGPKIRIHPLVKASIMVRGFLSLRIHEPL